MARLRSVALGTGLAVAAAGCGGTLDAGRDQPHGLLPVDERNPAIIYNDWNRDNWGGEYALLLANSGGPPLAGVIVTTSKYWGNIDDNRSSWTDMFDAARMSGVKNIPPVTPSTAVLLNRPADGNIDKTMANNSAGANVIVNLSRQLSLPSRPVVVLAGTRLTDVADAYLIDHSVVDRVVVVAALGEYGAPTGTMNGPNGDLDPWADWIVASKFRYVQVSAYYDQTGDVPTADIPSLPQNAFGAWMADKQPGLQTIPNASDQIAPLSIGLSTFATMVQRSAPDTTVAFDPMQGPPLRPDDNGNTWVVTTIAAPLAKSRLWEMLLDPKTFGG